MARKAKVERSPLARNKAATKDAVMAVAVELAVARKAKETPHLRLRVEPSLLARLQKSADKNGRTLTGEIVDRLDASFKRDDMQAFMEATAQKISEKLLAAAQSGASEAAKRKIVDDEAFELDLKFISELYPDTPKEEHARILRETNARRHARRGE
jgi:hypothetical protein